jgi:hypothetical protein
MPFLQQMGSMLVDEFCDFIEFYATESSAVSNVDRSSHILATFFSRLT